MDDIRIEAPDAASAAYLMRDLVCRLPVELLEPNGPCCWTVVVHAGKDPDDALIEAIAIVGRWLRCRGLEQATVVLGARRNTVWNTDFVKPSRAA